MNPLESFLGYLALAAVLALTFAAGAFTCWVVMERADEPGWERAVRDTARFFADLRRAVAQANERERQR